MDDEKKPEASGEGSERLGPYVIQEQVQQSHDSQEGVYLVTNETSGAKALGRQLPAEEGTRPGNNWRVMLEFWASRGYSAMEVQYTDWARSQDKQSAESMLITLEAVLEEVQRMIHAISGTHEPRRRWRLGWDVAGAVTVCALLFALVRLAPVSQLPSAPPALTGHEESTAAEMSPPSIDKMLADTIPEAPFVLVRPLPKEPYKGQKRPPCTRYAEVELIGACWMPHELKPPCPESLHEHEGKCYVPSFSAKPPPSSLGQ